MVISERPRRARGELRRQQLLDAAIQVIYERGVSGATHRAIAAHAGVPASSTTYFFDTIDDLIGEALSGVMLREIQRLDELQQQVEADDLTPEQTIDAFVDLVAGASDADYTAQFEVYLFASRKPALQARTVEIIAATRRTAEAALRRYGVRDAVGASAAVIAMIDGFALHRLAHPDPEDYSALRRGLRAALAGFLVMQASGDIPPD
ncbi:TetR/AcrR family transcriptional regulator [Glaciihabitans sp. dw_435]|uniref:TetR/AcrR family transcriptional regulator n=1 Tax=Glaciihabitans sp. dw_435 TaxID=2720081 RepID=UPI001BD23F25|nr:TetR family transcriptional regulator [Glaciihabitans sp. dw_435]